MSCSRLDNENCSQNGPCAEWIEWEASHPDSESHDFCKQQLSRPLTQEQKDELQYIIFNGLTPVVNYLFILKEHQTQRENLVDYIERCEQAIDALKDRLRDSAGI